MHHHLFSGEINLVSRVSERPVGRLRPNRSFKNLYAHQGCDRLLRAGDGRSPCSKRIWKPLIMRSQRMMWYITTREMHLYASRQVIQSLKWCSITASFVPQDPSKQQSFQYVLQDYISSRPCGNGQRAWLPLFSDEPNWLERASECAKR